MTDIKQSSQDLRKKTIQVSLAIITQQYIRNNDTVTEFLVAWRDDSKHQGGCYEFVGGKVESDEQPEQALIRECKEEIAIDIKKAQHIDTIVHDYTDILVELFVFHVPEFSGTPKGNEGQKLDWISYQQLQETSMPKANDVIKQLCKNFV